MREEGASGYLCLLLHAHLPFVRHPEHEEFLEEDWLFEAISDTYLPLLSLFEGWEVDAIPFSLTLTLSPTLLAMLTDDLLKERYRRHLSKQIDLAAKEVARTASDQVFAPLAVRRQEELLERRRLYDDVFDGDLVAGFVRWLDLGRIEIITTAATHGYLPLMSLCPEAVAAQIGVACDDYRRIIGRRPRGIWLPECGYIPGVEKVLADNDLEFFFLDAHGIAHATPRPRHGVFAPLITPAGVAAFGRDIAASREVWSARHGYPGDPAYRDFYRDIGYDLPIDYIRPYVQPNGLRKMTGFKYYRITEGDADRGEEKEVYRPEPALRKAREHAADFVNKRLDMIEKLAPLVGRPPLITAPFDAELFGHWWYEGPEFLNFLFRKLVAEPHLTPVTPVEYLARHSENQTAQPTASSWGEGGFSGVWLDGENDWIYRHLHMATDRMVELATSHKEATGLIERACRQAARELLLAQSSDWAFIMKGGTMTPYAEKMTRESLKNFTRLYDQIVGDRLDEEWLKSLEESRSPLFPGVDYRRWAKEDEGAK